MATKPVLRRPQGVGGSVRFLQRRQLENSCNKQLRLSRQLLRDRMSDTSANLHSCTLVGHFGCVNAIEFSNGSGELLISGGDDRRVLLWNLERKLSSNQKPGPTACMKGEHNSNIFCLAVDVENKHIYSGGNDDQVIVHDTNSLETLDVFTHEDAVYGLSPSPTDSQTFASAGADGRILIWDLRQSTRDPFILANYAHSFHAVVYHPQEPRFLASANAKEGVALWDVRKPGSCLLRYSSSYTELNAMSVRFNMFGTKILALRRRLPPAIYNVHHPGPVVEFDHSGYYNSCTMKSCCFAGDSDQYILSGSDDFNLFLWQVPEPCDEKENFHISEATLVLSGHRQIVNQVRYNYSKNMIASAGVEKIIKLWSPVRYPGMTDKTDDSRRMFTHQQYFDMMISSNAALSHDYTLQSTDEDPHMMAFFDSLIQREVERSISSDSDSSDDESPASMFLDFIRDSSDSELTESDRGDHPRSQSEESASSDNEEKTYFTLTKGACIADNSSRTKPKTSSFELRGHQKKQNKSSSIPGTSTSGVKRRGDSSSEDASASSGDMFLMKLKSRLFKRITNRKKSHPPKELPKEEERKDSGREESHPPKELPEEEEQKGPRRKMSHPPEEVPGEEGQEIPGRSRFKRVKRQEEKDRLTNLRQRKAFCKLLRDRIPESSDSDSDDDEEGMDGVLKTLANSLNHRTDVARQRGAALRIKKLKITNDEGIPSQRFKISSQEPQAGSSSTDLAGAQVELEVRLNSNSSVNGVGQVSSTSDGADGKQNKGQGHELSKDVPQASGSSHQAAECSGGDGRFKKMKKGKKKNYRTKGKDGDS